MEYRDRTVAIQRSIETGERHPLHYFDTRTYVQHNLALGDGLAPLLRFLDGMPPGSAAVTPHRAFQDGDISFAHLEYTLPGYGHVVGFEVHRWNDDRVVEHWDNLQPFPATGNSAGVSVVDGSTDLADPGATGDNKQLIGTLTCEALIARRPDLIGKHVADDVLSHAPAAGRGLDLFTALSTGDNEYQRLHHVFGEGNFVLALAEGVVAGQHTAFYDLYRLAGGRVVEHWDVREPIPDRGSWANDNGKF